MARTRKPVTSVKAKLSSNDNPTFRVELMLDTNLGEIPCAANITYTNAQAKRGVPEFSAGNEIHIYGATVRKSREQELRERFRSLGLSGTQLEEAVALALK